MSAIDAILIALWAGLTLAWLIGKAVSFLVARPKLERLVGRLLVVLLVAVTAGRTVALWVMP